MMMMRNEMSVERLNDGVETAEGFCYLGNALNVNGGSEMTDSSCKNKYRLNEISRVWRSFA